MKKVLVTGIGDAMGIAVIKALCCHASGYLVYGGDADPLAPGLFDNRLQESVLLPKAKDPGYKETILSYCCDKSIDVFIPCSEAEIIEISRFREEFDSIKTKVLVPDYETLMKAADKSLTCQLAQRHGIPYPKTVAVRRESFHVDMESVLAQMDFPLIVKPCRSQGAKGIEYVYQPSALAFELDRLLDKYGKLLVQELIPGKQGSMYLFGTVTDRTHQCKAVFNSRSLKTKFEFGGPAIAGESVRNERLTELGKRMVDALERWVGPLMIEFMLDPRDQEFKLIEINPRLWGYNYLATAAGINFPKLVVDLALGESVPCCDVYEEGKVLIRVPNDIIVDRSALKDYQWG